jgi:hypothetical protein
LAGSKDERADKRPRILYVVPIISVLILVTVYYVAFATPPSSPLVQNFSFQFSIDLYSQYSNGTPYVQFSFPDRAVGIFGGYWVNHAFDGDGVKGVYPIYSPNPAAVYPNGVYPGYTTAYVRSVTNRTYYLSDYFAVWGEPLGKNNTVGYTSPPQSSAYPSSWTWWMCVGPTQSSLRSGLWGREPLVPGLRIILAYEDTSPCQGT